MFFCYIQNITITFLIRYAYSLNSQNWVCTAVSCLYLNMIYVWFNLFTSGIICMCYTSLHCWNIKTEVHMFCIAGDEPRCEEGEPTSVQVPCQILPRRRCRGTDSGYYSASFLFAGNLILVHRQESDCCTNSATWTICKAICFFFVMFISRVVFPDWYLVLRMSFLFGLGVLRSNYIIHSIVLIWIFYLWQICGELYLFLHTDYLVAYSKLIFGKLLC